MKKEGVNPKKIKQVEELKTLINQYPNIGILNMYKMPAAQLGQMRKKLSSTAKIFMAKRVVIEKAFPQKLDGLRKYLDGQPALLLTKSNPFTLFKQLEKSKTNAPAKIGQIVPEDIIVPAGSTGLPPGPAIGTFSSAGLKASVKEGKIHIMSDGVLLKAGAKVTPEANQVLAIMKIAPIRIGLDLQAVYEDGTIFDKSVLRIDEKEFNSTLTSSIQHAFNLAVEIEFATKDTIEFILSKAARHAKGLAQESKDVNAVVTDEYKTLLSLSSESQGTDDKKEVL